ERVLAVKLLLIVVALIRRRAKARRVETGSDHFRTRGEAADVDLVGGRGRPESLGQVKSRLSRLALLCRNDDHAIGASRSVDRAGRRTLEDLDVLDVVRVEVGRPVDALVLGRSEVAATSL